MTQKLMTTWTQSPPMTIPMPQLYLSNSDEAMDMSFHEAKLPQLSFEAREGQMLVRAYMYSRDNVTEQHNSMNFMTKSPLLNAHRHGYHDDDTIFRMDL
ncbi:hypothetical protein THRCLA_21869 [Thraustotheca clavata]|uniref:Uncharacterized protein n=1 Tax=Thraustotheca clavata TaxID=74557 RepID=A0A1V9ZLC0_9STRA|nr:hypothetical protein THRCLA_21869 [Thraustotheca clavata]